MKYGDITIAYKAVCELYKTEGIGLKNSRALFDLKKRLQPHVEFQQEQEMAVLEELNALNPDGTIKVTTELDRRLGEIADQETEWTEEPITLKVTEEMTFRMKVSGEMLEKVNGFIEFELI